MLAGMDKNKRFLIAIDAVIILGSLISIFFIVGYSQPLVIAPIDSENGDLLFTLPANDYILIDDNSQFDSFETIFIDESINLESGRYFIKFFDGLKSEIRQIDTEENLVIEFRELEDGSIGVFNIGEDILKVETYKIGTLVNSSFVYTGGDNE